MSLYRKGLTPIPDSAVPAYRLRAAKAVIRELEAELLELKGPCRVKSCRLHRAHRGPCDIVMRSLR